VRIDPGLPFHIATAYGLRPAGRAPSLRVADSAQAVQGSAPAARIDQLIAGRTRQPVDFSAVPAARSTSGGAPLQLYTRAADRVEAAVGVHLGRGIDVRA
jgi:hypothetical protein